MSTDAPSSWDILGTEHLAGGRLKEETSRVAYLDHQGPCCPGDSSMDRQPQGRTLTGFVFPDAHSLFFFV